MDTSETVPFLNCGVQRWANVSAVAGLDFADDGRALATVDWDHDGDLDLWLRNRTGPRLRLMRNGTNPSESGRTFVAFYLEGTESNRDAIGARVEVVATGNGRRANGENPGNPKSKIQNLKLVQTLYAGDGYLSQSSKVLHFGLGEDPQIDRVMVRWPGGRQETFRGIQPGSRYRLKEGSGRPEELDIGRPNLKLASSVQARASADKAVRAVLPHRVLMPELPYVTFEGSTKTISATQSPLLVNIWASWCLPCLGELKTLSDHVSELNASGLNILTLSVDGLGSEPLSERSDAQRKLIELGVPFDAGWATPESLDKIEIIQEMLFGLTPSLEIPFSLLVDQEGRLAVIYRGAISLDMLLDDVAHLADEPPDWRGRATPLAGRWLRQPATSTLSMSVSAAEAFMDHEYLDDAARYVAAIRRHVQTRFESANLSQGQRSRLTRTASGPHVNLARAMFEGGRPTDAKRVLEQAIQINPDDAMIHNNLANILTRERQFDQAIVHYRRCLALKPGSAEAHMNIAIVYSAMARTREAIENYRRAIEFDSNWAEAYVNLGIELTKMRKFDEAIENLERALALRPDYPHAHYNLATVYAQRLQFDDAVRHYRQALDARPNYARAHAGLGHVLFRQEKFDDAVVELREAVKADPQLPPARFHLAIVLRQRGEREAALSHLQEAVRLVPDWTDAHSELASTHQLLGNDAEAIRHFREALRLSEGRLNSDLLINTAKRLAWVLATHPDETLRDGAEALRWAKAVCETVQNRNAGALATLAVAHAECGQFAEAVATIEKALDTAIAAGPSDARNRFGEMLELFQADRPYRQNARSRAKGPGLAR